MSDASLHKEQSDKVYVLTYGRVKVCSYEEVNGIRWDMSYV